MGQALCGVLETQNHTNAIQKLIKNGKFYVRSKLGQLRAISYNIIHGQIDDSQRETNPNLHPLFALLHTYLGHTHLLRLTKMIFSIPFFPVSPEA